MQDFPRLCGEKVQTFTVGREGQEGRPEESCHRNTEVRHDEPCICPKTFNIFKYQEKDLHS